MIKENDVAGKIENKVNIIGAGFSGLSLAYFFVKAGFKVTVFEKTNRVGGVIHSYQAQNFEGKNYLVETAANGFLNSKKIEELFQDIDCKMIFTLPEARNRFVYRWGRLTRWPLTSLETMDFVCRLAFRFCSFSIKPKPQENLKDWALRCTNKSFNDYLLQPMVNGIFATATEKLSAKLVFGSLFYKKEGRPLRKGLVSAELGMNQVIDKLRNYLKEQHVEFIEGKEFEIKSLGKVFLKNVPNVLHNAFSASPLSSLDTQLEPLFPQKKTSHPIHRSVNLLRVTISFIKASELNGFGVLFPRVENFNSLGVLANTKIFPYRGDYNESWILGGSEKLDLIDLTDNQIKELIIADRKRLFPNDNFVIDQFHIHRWRNVVPEYNLDLEQMLSNQDLQIDKMTGNFLGVLGLSGIHERNSLLVEKYIKKSKEKLS